MKKTINILDLVQNIMGAKLVHLEQISKSYWSHTGTFSLTNLSRWVLCTSKRSIERFYARPHDWSEHMGILIISFFSRHVKFIKDFNQSWVLAGDETVDKKSGHATHGIGYAYSSKAEKVIKGMSVLNLSLVHRYQIEFNFRDARQFFGLSNFKNIKKQQVQNVIGYAFFMVTLSNILLFEIKQKYPDSKFSIQDLKAYFRAEKYLNELLNKDELTASLFLNLKQNIHLPIIGAINPL